LLWSSLQSVSLAIHVLMYTLCSVVVCVHRKRSGPQPSVPVPKPDQVMALIKARRSIYPKDYTGVKVGD
jgi:hypothetical protein